MVLDLLRRLLHNRQTHDEYIDRTRDSDGQWEHALIQDDLDKSNADSRDALVLKRTIEVEELGPRRGRQSQSQRETADWVEIGNEDALCDLGRWR